MKAEQERFAETAQHQRIGGRDDDDDDEMKREENMT